MEKNECGGDSHRLDQARAFRVAIKKTVLSSGVLFYITSACTETDKLCSIEVH
jgi:hypothetical protein